jgi:hypothetical protein
MEMKEVIKLAFPNNLKTVSQLFVKISQQPRFSHVEKISRTFECQKIPEMVIIPRFSFSERLSAVCSHQTRGALPPYFPKGFKTGLSPGLAKFINYPFSTIISYIEQIMS